MRHLGRKLEPCREALRRHEELARLRQCAKRAVELVDQSLPAAPREPLARKREQLAERRDADAREKCFIGADDADRQLFEGQARTPSPPQRRACRRRGGERGLQPELG